MAARRLRTHLLCLLICLVALAAHGQGTPVSGQVTTTLGKPAASVPVRVCLFTSTGAPCNPTSAIYSDPALTIPISNPYTTDQFGNYRFFVGQGYYTIQVTPDGGVNTYTYLGGSPSTSTLYAEQCAGADAFAKINNCAASLPPTGGIIDARGFGAATYEVSTPLTALSVATKPVTLLLNPYTRFNLNIVYPQTLINSNITTQTSGATGACAVPVGNNSSIVTTGYSDLGGRYGFYLGPNAALYDVVCNAAQDGTQENLLLDGLSVTGNVTAVMSGSLLHIVKVYLLTAVNNSSLYYPFGTALTMTGAGNINFYNDNFQDGYPYASGIPIGSTTPTKQYAGPTVLLACDAFVNFYGGSIEDNGKYNPLLVIENCTVNTQGGIGVPSPIAGYQSYSIHFYNTYFEIEPAQVGTFTGASTNVNPIQSYDVSDLLIDGATVNGAGGYPSTDPTYPSNQTHLFDLLSPTTNNAQRGPVTIRNIQILDQWGQGTGRCIVSNTVNAIYATAVAPSLQCVNAGPAGPELGLGEYRWTGSGSALTNVVDYEDQKNVANLTANQLTVPALTYAGLPSCTSSRKGQIATISDANAPVLGKTTTGGGSTMAQVFCSGTQWIVSVAPSTAQYEQVRICASGCDINVTLCTTSGSALSSGACAVGQGIAPYNGIMPWPVPFADNFYSLTCNALGLVGPSAGVRAVIGGVAPAAKVTTGFTVNLESLNAAAGSALEIDCIGVHN